MPVADHARRMLERECVVQGSMGKVLADAKSQRRLARKAMDELESSHRLVLDSIRYASLLQQAQLPRPIRLENRFEDIAVHWEPRDTIGGDLWWISHSSQQDKFTVCVADCSGHGVPGAMLALLAAIATGVVAPKDAFSGFSDDIVIIVASAQHLCQWVFCIHIPALSRPPLLFIQQHAV